MKYSALALLASFLFLPSACGSPVSTGDGDGDDGNIDKDGDKIADHLGQSLDQDMDGVADCFDINNDGVEECVGVDTDGDGELDAIGFDTDGDGIVDALDTTGDGVPDVTGTGGAGNTGGGSGTGGGGPGAGGGGPGSGGGSVLGASCADADIFCADFETAEGGSNPDAAPWNTAVTCGVAGYSRTVVAGAGLDGSAGFVTSGAATNTGTCALVYDLGTLTDFWVTAWIKVGGSHPDTQHEVTFFELAENAGQDDPELRIGYRGDNSCPNGNAAYQGFELGATKGTTGGEYTGCTGSKVNDGIPVADEWYCLEVHVTQGSGSLVADLWVDGENQDFLVHSSPETDVGGAFEAKYLKVGQQSYSGEFDSLTMDDVSVSSTQIPCPTK